MSCKDSKINFVHVIPPKDKRCPNSLYFLNEGGVVTAYVTDSLSEIHLYSGNSAGGGTGDITIQSPKDTIDVDKIGNNFNIDVNRVPAEDVTYETTDVDERIRYILGLLVEPVVYTPPTISLNDFSRTVEMGSNVSNILANITYNRNDAGDYVEYRIDRKVDGGSWNEISHNSSHFINETNITNKIEYRGRASYSKGDCKTNNMGEIDCNGRIEAGAVTTGTRAITPQLKVFYGYVAQIPSNGSQVRVLRQNDYETKKVYNLNTGNTTNKFVIYIPFSKSILEVIDEGNMGITITNEYKLINDNFEVPDASGQMHRYKEYVMTITRDHYEKSTIHKITTT